MADTITNIVTHTITNTITETITNTIELTNTVINVIDKIDIVDITQPIAWYKNFTFWGTVASIATVYIGWKVYESWRIDKVIQMHTNLKNQKYIYYNKLDTKCEKECEEECEKVIIEYAVDYLNELELIADIILRKHIDFKLAQEHFRTFYQIVGNETWSYIIDEQKKEDKDAYRKLLELAKKFKYKKYENDKEK